MTVGIADVTAGLVWMLFRRRQELGAPGAPGGVRGLDVLDPKIEEAAGAAGIAGRLEGDPRLVVGRPSAGVYDDEAVGQLDHGRHWAEDPRAAEAFAVEARRALDIVGDDEVVDHESVWERWELGHLEPPLVGLAPRVAPGLRSMLPREVT